MKKQKIIGIWCAPRSASTALFLAFKQISGIRALFEPFDMNFYYSRERLSNRYLKKGSVSRKWHNYTGDAILKELAKKNRLGLTIVKECAFQAKNYLNSGMTEVFDYHIIIIRDPRLTLFSLLKYKPDFTEIEAGYADLDKLYELLVANKSRLIIVDSYDLRRRPNIVLRIICEKTGVKFTKKMLYWPKFKKNVGFAAQADMYKRVLSSSGFQLPNEPCPDILSFKKKKHRKIVKEAIKIYNKLYQKRIKL